MSETVGDAQVKALVARGYDVIAERYASWSVTAGGDSRRRCEEMLFDLVAPPARVLELGCGFGSRSTRRLAQRYHVVGVDVSSRSIELARLALPDSEFVRGDMTEVEFTDSSFEAVTAFYSIIHVPREKHSALLHQIAGWMRPGGVLVATMTAHDVAAGFEDDWLGVRMYWSGFSADANRELVRDAGLEILSDRVETNIEHGKDVDHLWIVARKPG